MKSLNFWYAVALILWASQTVQSVEIECIPLRSCHVLLKMLTTRKQSPEMLEFLKFSHCGFDESSQPMVWCSKLNFCKTPDNKNGTCTPMQQCKPFLQLANTLGYQNQYHLDQFRCDRLLEEVHVCCPTEPSPNPSISTKNSFDYEGYDYEDGLMGDDPEPYNAHGFFHRHNHDRNYHNHRHNHGHDVRDEDSYHHKHESRDSGRDSSIFSNHDGGTNDYDHTSHGTTEHWGFHERTTESTRKQTTPSRRRSFTTPRDRDAIIFEDSLEDFTTEKSKRSTTARTETNRNEDKKSCETPDKKTGICTEETDCQRYLKLKNNLDKSKKSVRDYLSNFKCNSTNKPLICCQKEEETDIDNSVFNHDRTNENVPEPLSKICGRQTANIDKIFGGSVADLGEFPWMALLQYPSNKGMQFGCGGTLISDRHVLTAAHCVDENILKAKGLGKLRQVVLGEYDVRNETDCIYMEFGDKCADPPKIFGVDSIITHSKYNASTTRHDIALIKLNQEVKFTDYIKPICLPTKTSTINGNETFIIAGWGRTPTEPSSPILKKAKIPYVPKNRCNSRTSSNRALIEGQICAGLGNGTDSCNGDSGGPLMLEVNFNFELVTHLVGLISYGFGECASSPSVNTYIPYYVDWIKETMI